MDASIQEQADAGLEVVNARLNYLAEAIPKPVNYAYDPPAGVPRSSGKHVLQNVLIRNGRDMLGELSLDTNGFVLINHQLSGKIVFALAGGVRGKHGLHVTGGRCISREGSERNTG